LNSAFEDFFSKIYESRWSDLKRSLILEEPKTQRSCFHGYATYYLDSASVRAAESLRVQPHDEVLDMCAAPGGKTLILAECLSGRGSLVANELSRDRKARLLKVLDEHVPESYRKLIQVTGYDGNQFGLKKPNSFDRILLDAPCSSERHLLHEDPDMKDWKESRTKQLMMRQYSLLCSALLSLKTGGALIYSTCSISPFENDGVVERLLKKKSDQVKVDPDNADLIDLEQTQFGYQIFPDRANGAGPIYFSRLIKI
jgi:16S rRNA C967 or C1407 C5-methylase (RsmB/RsmF family)